jgi:ADP-heptose:LPS heptosyltransferase
MSVLQRCLVNAALRLLGPFSQHQPSPIGAQPLARIVVLRFGGIGDTIAVTALLAALRYHYPNARIELVTTRLCAPLLDGNPDIDAVHTSEPLFATWNPFAWRRRRRIIRDLSTPAPDALVCTHNSVVAILACLSWRARYLVGIGTDDHGFVLARTHARRACIRRNPHLAVHRKSYLGDRFVDLLAFLRGEPVGDFAPKLVLREEERTAARARVDVGNGPLVALLPGGTDRRKLWPAIKYATLARQLAARHKARTLLVGGSDVAERSTPFTGVTGLKNFAGTLKLRESIALLSEIDLAIGNDSGMMHVVAALGRPTLVLCGRMDPSVYSSSSSRNFILQAPHDAPIAALEVSAVRTAAEGMLDLVGGGA